jgi:hypothetical protein
MPSLTVAGTGLALAAGAFAFGQGDTHGWASGSAYNYKTPSEAQEAAMTRCRSRKEAGSYCKIITTINGRCFAIAVQESGNGYGWNMAATVPEAEKLAMDHCTGYGKSCSVHDSFCDTVTVSSPAAPPAAAPATTAPASPSAPSSSTPSPSAPSPAGGSPACQKFPDLC